MSVLIKGRIKGAGYEKTARCYLQDQGMQFIAANVVYRGGELDLIMQDQQTWVFVEVRYRRNANFGDAASTVDWHKQQRLLATASKWLAEKGMSFDSADCRFDILAITGNELQWLPNAFNADE